MAGLHICKVTTLQQFRSLKTRRAKLPNLAVVQYHLGMSYLAAGQDEKASERFKKARELAPNDTELKAKIDAALKTQSEKNKG